MISGITDHPNTQHFTFDPAYSVDSSFTSGQSLLSTTESNAGPRQSLINQWYGPAPEQLANSRHSLVPPGSGTLNYIAVDQWISSSTNRRLSPLSPPGPSLYPDKAGPAILMANGKMSLNRLQSPKMAKAKTHHCPLANCDATTVRHADMLRHVKNVHEKTNQIYECSIKGCSVVSLRIDKIQEHREKRGHHGFWTWDVHSEEGRQAKKKIKRRTGSSS